MPSPSKTKEDIKSKVKDGHEIEFSVMEDSGKRKKYTAIAVAWVDRHDDDNDESLEKLQIRYHNGLEGYVDPDTSEMRLQKCSDKPLTEEEIQAKYKPLVSPGGDEAGRSLAGKDLVGKRVKVWWPDESKFFEGEVQSFDEAKGKHSILYDDGEREDIEFSNEVWQLLGEATKKPKSVKRKAEPKKEEGPAEKKSRSSVKKPPPPPAAARSKSVATPQAVADERAVPVYSSPVALVKTPDYQIWQHAGTPIRYSLYFKVAEGLKASDVVVSNTRAHVQVEVPVDAVQPTPDTSPAHAEAPGCPAAPDAVVKSEAQGGASTQPARGSGQEPEEGGSEAAEQSAGTKPASRADAGKQQQRAAASGAATPNGSRGPAGVEAQRRTYVVILPHPCVDTSKTICELTVSGQLYIRCYLDQGLLPPLGPS